MLRSSELPAKKVYQAPKLARYGSLTEMTMATSMALSKGDGGAPGKRT